MPIPPVSVTFNIGVSQTDLVRGFPIPGVIAGTTTTVEKEPITNTYAYNGFKSQYVKWARK
ncbi:uncharacterized protein G2W53_041727 [Senna tora]|uniref:Uncharacterized protein n=1 Tax=Senna tora TaxID=362788 RepID=A0A834SG59_9FABA|nr:uncharacterized protein G2W53_041727 [Senna tora]